MENARICNLSTKLLALASVVLLTSACGHKGPRVEIEPHAFVKTKNETIGFADEDTAKPKGYHSSVVVKDRNRTYASVKVYLSDDDDAKPLQIDLKRHDRAYLAETPLYQEDKFATYISVGMDKDSKYVAGLRMRWQF